MNDTNSHVYLVMQYDASMGKEWVMFAYDTPWEAEEQAKLIEMESKGLTQYFVKSVRYFRKVVNDG